MEKVSVSAKPPNDERLSHLQALLSEWDSFIEAVKNDRLYRSLTREQWDRCRLLGIDPANPTFRYLTAGELDRKRIENEVLITEARPYMDQLSFGMYDIPHIVALSDAEGWILELAGPAGELGGRAAGFAPGSSWAESAIGNNGIGTCLAKGEQVFIYGVEHYADAYGGWGCLGVPIRDPEGTVVGALDISVPVEHAHPSRLTLAFAVVRSIERAVASSILRSTDREKREQAEFQSLALEAGNLGIWRHDLSSGLIRFDERARLHYGFTTDTVPLAEVIARVHPEDRPRLSDEMRTVLDPADGKERFQTEYRVIHPDGEIRWLQISVRVHFSGVGEERKPVRGFGTTRDVTEWRRQELALEAGRRYLRLALNGVDEERRKLHAVLEILPIPVYIADADGRIVMTNNAAESVFGKAPRSNSPDEYGEDYKAWWPDSGKRVASDEWGLARAVAHGETVLAEEMEIETSAGERKTILNYAIPIGDDSGRIIGGVALNVDVTDRKRVEDALRRNELRLKEELFVTECLHRLSLERTRADSIESLYGSILETAMALVRSDFASLQMFYPSEGGGGELRLLAHRGFTAYAAAFWRTVRFDSESSCAEALRKGKRVFVPDVYGCEFMAGSGDLATYRETGIRSVQSTPLFSRTGELLGMISTHWKTLRELTENDLRALDLLAGQASDLLYRWKAEENLLKAWEAAEAANRAKSDFLANMSHEIRTPISGILGMLDLVDSRIKAPDLREYLSLARESAGSLLAIIGDILDLSRIESGVVELEVDEWDIRKSLSSLCAPFRMLADQKGLGFTLEAGETVPECVKADGEKVCQVLRNLISNAIKYTERGNVSVSVSGDPLPDSRTRLRFEVRDTGVGIPGDKRETIFESFVRLRKSVTEKKAEGTGLGLTITKRLSDMMGGSIAVESAPGKGSTFIFTVDVEAAEPAGREPGETHRARLADLPPLSILVVEDNRINRMFLEVRLTDAGHRITSAEHGEEALEAVVGKGDELFDLILMDVQMPVLDGIETTKRIRALPGPASQVPIIALTAFAMKGDEERFLRAGMNGYVTKPIDWDRLAQVIRKLWE